MRFSSQDGQLRKGKVVAWDGPDSGYTVRLLGKQELMRGIVAERMVFLAGQEEVEARMTVHENEISGVSEEMRRKRPRTSSELPGEVRSFKTRMPC